MKKDIRASRGSAFKKGKVKGVGLFERLYLNAVGRMDGKAKLPRELNDGSWMSPHIDREIASFEEFAALTWGKLQLTKEEEYTRLRELTDSLPLTKSLLKSAEAELLVAVSNSGVDKTRKHGESRLTEAQVVERRTRERAKRLAPIRARVDALKSKLTAEAAEFSSLRNKIIEDENTTRLICLRVKDHLLQRMDIYWDSALKKHPDRARMPAVPSVEITATAEEAYLAPHKELMEKAERISCSLSAEEKEVA